MEVWVKFKITVLSYVTGNKSTFWEESEDSFDWIVKIHDEKKRQDFWEEVSQSQIHEVCVIREVNVTYYVQRTE